MEHPRQPWTQSPESVLSALEVDPGTGLTGDEVDRRRERYGPNRLREAEERSLWSILWDQLKSIIVVLLVVAIGVSLAFGHWVEAVAIGVVIVVNAAIGFFTELRAVRAMESLRELGQADSKVRRDGDVVELPAVELVPGDIVVLERGEVLGADVRLLEVEGLQVDESPLTGESVPVTKRVEPVGEETPLAERESMAYKGTAVTRGEGLGVVVTTGMDTEIGEISEMVGAADAEETPLEKRLDTLGHRLVWLTIAVAGVVAVTGILAGREIFLMVETGIALAVAAVPEGLPIVATIALARGVQRMARRNALIRRLSSVETLGSTTVICADKTGTLTENRMEVTTLVLPSGRIDVEVDDDGRATFSAEDADLVPEGEVLHPGGEDTDPHDAGLDLGGDDAGGRALLREALRVAVLANEADADAAGGAEDGPGDPMELALLRLGQAAGMPRDRLVDRFPRSRLVRFQRETGMVASYHEAEEWDEGLIAVKGAPEAVLGASDRQAGPDGPEPLTGEDRDRWLERNEALAGRGLRVLALARKDGTAEDEPYQELVLLGLIGMLDPPRAGVAEAVRECRDAGIRVVMVTGDHPETARQIAGSVGIGDADELTVVTGQELEDAAEDDARRTELVETARVFARVDPGQKLRLIDGFQERGEILAMTGDGVNDAPALKRADIGIAMGERGTEVAREAADMVLLDDAFSTIVEAVRHGRVIFRNVRKFVVYLMSGNVGEILAVGGASVAGAPLPLLPLQILYLNLVNDVFPALALGVGKGEGHVMDQPPRDPDESILEPAHWRGIAGYGLLITVAILGAFFWALEGLELDVPDAVTTSFLVLSGARLLHVFNMRDRRSGLLRNEVSRNPWVWGAIALCIGLLALAVYVPPLAGILSLRPPSGAQWLVIAAGSAFPLVAGQLYLALRAALETDDARS
ncbi:MAG: cation-transporting P-type ATPase [Longimicrobiales bacterium]|nr:cation-transporting P-type ATPase [Longimicrobiales bacterium]